MIRTLTRWTVADYHMVESGVLVGRQGEPQLDIGIVRPPESRYNQ